MCSKISEISYSSLLSNLHDEALNFSKSIVGMAARDDVARHGIALYGSMLEYLGGIILLIDGKKFIGIPSLFRSFLEVYVEIANLFKNPLPQLDSMFLTCLNQWFNIIQAAINGNPNLTGLGNSDQLRVHLKNMEIVRKEMNKSGRIKLSIEAKFKKSPRPELYDSYYRIACSSVHNNLSALMSRHFVMDKDRNFSGIEYYKDVSIENIAPMLDLVAGLILEVSDNMYRNFKTDSKVDTDRYIHELNHLREAINKHPS